MHCPNKKSCGARTQISGSGSRRLNIWTPVPEQFGTLKTKNHCIICGTRLPKKLCLWNWNPNFNLQLQHRKISGSGSSHPKLLGLQLHSPANYSSNHQQCCTLLTISSVALSLSNPLLGRQRIVVRTYSQRPDGVNSK